MRKIPFAGIELTSQRVRGLRGTSELPGRPAYNIGKPTVTLYAYIINHHVGTPKQKQTSYYFGVYIINFGLRVPNYDGAVTFYREIKLKIGFGVVISKEVYRP